MNSFKINDCKNCKYIVKPAYYNTLPFQIYSFINQSPSVKTKLDDYIDRENEICAIHKTFEQKIICKHYIKTIKRCEECGKPLINVSFHLSKFRCNECLGKFIKRLFDKNLFLSEIFARLDLDRNPENNQIQALFNVIADRTLTAMATFRALDKLNTLIFGDLTKNHKYLKKNSSNSIIALNNQIQQHSILLTELIHINDYLFSRIYFHPEFKNSFKRIINSNPQEIYLTRSNTNRFWEYLENSDDMMDWLFSKKIRIMEFFQFGIDNGLRLIDYFLSRPNSVLVKNMKEIVVHPRTIEIDRLNSYIKNKDSPLKNNKWGHMKFSNLFTIVYESYKITASINWKKQLNHAFRCASRGLTISIKNEFPIIEFLKYIEIHKNSPLFKHLLYIYIRLADNDKENQILFHKTIKTYLTDNPIRIMDFYSKPYSLYDKIRVYFV